MKLRLSKLFAPPERPTALRILQALMENDE